MFTLTIIVCLLAPGTEDCDMTRTVVYREPTPFTTMAGCRAQAQMYREELGAHARKRFPNTPGRVISGCEPVAGDPA